MLLAGTGGGGRGEPASLVAATGPAAKVPSDRASRLQGVYACQRSSKPRGILLPPVEEEIDLFGSSDLTAYLRCHIIEATLRRMPFRPVPWPNSVSILCLPVGAKEGGDTI